MWLYDLKSLLYAATKGKGAALSMLHLLPKKLTQIGQVYKVLNRIMFYAYESIPKYILPTDF